jgi:hypothetical protein
MPANLQRYLFNNLIYDILIKLTKTNDNGLILNLHYHAEKNYCFLK